MPYAEVAVDSPIQGRTFSYAIPGGMSVRVGHAVQVPFGPRQLPGFVFDVTELPGYHETRDIAKVIGDEPLLTQAQVKLASWVAETYRSSTYAAAALMVPSGYRQKVAAFYELLTSPGADILSQLEPAHGELLAYLHGHGRVAQRQLAKEFGGRNAERLLGRLVRRKLVQRTWAFQRSAVHAKEIGRYHLAMPLDEALAKVGKASTRRRMVLATVAKAGGDGILAPDLREAGAPSPAIKTLVRDGLLVESIERVTRDPLAGRTYKRTKPLTLTPAQQTAWSDIETAMDRPAPPEPSAF
ncbi:MAG: hypothetical protein HY261_07420, partial [Chloroflexi bacterium]|nr:hypothetical protein [Chloroflexota bacterium]